MPFEHYIIKGTRKLRMGFTTGCCAALASKASAEMLLSGSLIDEVEIITPKGLPVKVPVLEAEIKAGYAVCAVQKDAGDDPDITDGILIFSKVCMSEEQGIAIDGGLGVGRVTRPGLDQPIGAAAINRIPRLMIEKEVRAVCESFNYERGLSVSISIPDGIRLAKKTFNPKLGIENGISVLGTSGIVEPQSTQALIDCIGIELRALAAEGHDKVILTPGNYGEEFLKNFSFPETVPTVKFSNYTGEALDYAAINGFKTILLVGHIGKFVKLAGGIMNSHSAVADCRMELFAAHTALLGADRKTLSELMNCVSADACIEILDKCGMRQAVMSSLLNKIQEHIERRAGEGISIGAVLFSNTYGLLGQSCMAANIIDELKGREIRWSVL